MLRVDAARGERCARCSACPCRPRQPAGPGTRPGAPTSQQAAATSFHAVRGGAAQQGHSRRAGGGRREWEDDRPEVRRGWQYVVALVDPPDDVVQAVADHRLHALQVPLGREVSQLLGLLRRGGGHLGGAGAGRKFLWTRKLDDLLHGAAAWAAALEI